MGFTTKCLAASLLVLGLTGCTSSSIVNLTPSQQPRNDAGLYLLEAGWKSNQRSIRYDSLNPRVVVGTNEYTMRQTQLLTNRWEALVPVPKDQKFLNYHFKFDFKYTTVPAKLNDSKISPPFKLKIVE